MESECQKEFSVERVSYQIWQISKFWQRGKHKLLESFGITASQMEILGATFHLNESMDEVTQIVLAQEANIDPMTTSTILRNLEKKGLVQRSESKTDTRARKVEMTQVGKKLFLEAIEKVKKSQREIFKNVDIVALSTQLDILLEELNKRSE